jgi:hypothetical protein
MKDYFYPGDAVPLSMGPGDSCDIMRLQMGRCLVSDRIPFYPKYFRGTLRLYFSNGQILDILLWTNDLRTGVSVSGNNCRRIPVAKVNSYFLVNGRCIKKPDSRNILKVHNFIIQGNIPGSF